MTSMLLAINAAFFHGNPGFFEDSESLRQNLGSQYQWIKGEDIKTPCEVELAVGYSYGAYSLLKAVADAKLKAKTIVLIAPFLKSDTPLSKTAILIMKIPFIRNLIVSKSWFKWKIELIDKMFSKSDLENSLVTKYLIKIGSENVWKDVVQAKLTQETQKLTPQKLEGSTIYVFVGSDDKTSSLSKVKEDLSALEITPTEEIIFPKASHGILFTHNLEIAQKLLKPSTKNSKEINP